MLPSLLVPVSSNIMKILIAEDDNVPRTVLARVLRKNGHEVVEAINGNEAWQVLQQPDPPKIVILDWMMPEMDGPEVLRRVRVQQTDRPTYIIMLTVKDDKDHIIAALASGANDYLTKPFDAGVLGLRVEVGVRLVEMQLRQHEQRAHAQRLRVEFDQRVAELQDALTSGTEKLHRSLAEQHELAARLLIVREEERLCIARQLRDSLGQRLAELQVDLMWMDRHLQTNQVTDRSLISGRITTMLHAVEYLTEQIRTIHASLQTGT